ncbi:hypothetical protein [Proteus mirabilis]|uniref:DUF7946 domain-containing protein n=1 Tax=Proteus mirabilis TaxID=584 RepID=UPI0034D4B16F
MKKELLTIKYDGEALSEHKIDLAVLSESLSGLQLLISEVNLILNGTNDKIDVKVEPFKAGSFEYLIDIVQHPSEYLDILSVIGLTATAGSAAKDSLISYIKEINNRTIKRMSFTQDGDCKIVLEDDESLVTPSFFGKLLTSKTIRKSLDKVIYSPLQHEGYELIKINDSEGNDIVECSKEESTAFKFNNRSKIIDPITHEVIIDDAPITFLTVHRDKNTNWRAEYESSPVTITMNDDAFYTKIIKGMESLVFSSTYLVKLKITEELNTGEKTYSIEKVYQIQ